MSRFLISWKRGSFGGSQFVESGSAAELFEWSFEGRMYVDLFGRKFLVPFPCLKKRKWDLCANEWVELYSLIPVFKAKLEAKKRTGFPSLSRCWGCWGCCDCSGCCLGFPGTKRLILSYKNTLSLIWLCLVLKKIKSCPTRCSCLERGETRPDTRHKMRSRSYCQ